MKENGDMKRVKLEVFHKRAKRNLGMLEQLGEYLSTHITSSRAFSSASWYLSITDELTESSMLISQYNKFGIEELPHVSEFPIPKLEEIGRYQMDSAMVRIKFAIREVGEVNDYLNIYLKPDLSEVEKSKIDSLRNALEKLKEQDCDLLIVQNLEEALSEGETSHHLACGLISARIIDHIIQFIKKEEELPNEDLVNNVIGKLRELGVIEKDKIAGQDKKEFFDAAKSSRDALSHKIEFMPTGPKAHSLLSYAFIAADIFVRYLEKKNEG